MTLIASKVHVFFFSVGISAKKEGDWLLLLAINARHLRRPVDGGSVFASLGMGGARIKHFLRSKIATSFAGSMRVPSFPGRFEQRAVYDKMSSFR